ncbi:MULTISPECIES: SMI1/KNR4 family protein [Myxococcus]|uniref:SMI1/KNR4 family protein n=1 Tax=Myxococcus TaxID=32 RepID=UPI0013D5EB77|nr:MULTISPECIES: SMI1/KNR4 family protein [Myxococcus]NVJ24471.1 SMI1/KNR4 family protein [Myxococcus sp. AM011]
MMDDFIALLGRYDPDYPATIRGAPHERIARFADLVGRELPPHYVDFLRRMGSNMGSLELPAVSFELDALIESLESEEWRPPPRYVLVAMELKDPYFDYYLDLDSPSEDDFWVVRFETGGNAVFEGRVHPGYHSLRALLFSLGFLSKRLKPMPARTTMMMSLSGQQESRAPQLKQLQSLKQIALKSGFEHLAHAGPSCLLLDREDAAIYAHHPPRGGLIVEVASMSEAGLSKVTEVLRDNTRLA